MGDPTGTFDFSRFDAPEDIVVRTSTDDGERWIDLLVTPSGRVALWNFGGFMDAEEAVQWAKSTMA